MSAAAAHAMHAVVLSLARERALEPVLEQIVAAARDLVSSRYAAIGIPDGLGGFAKFLYRGVSDEQAAQIGPLPRVHGLLAATLTTDESYRTDDISVDPRFQGWPPTHPDMRSFLGVPVVSHGEVIAAIYCTEKVSAPRFGPEDQASIELLAAHAAVAIDNARLWEQSRELVLAEERTALARQLHDAVSQRLFGLTLTTDAARRAVHDDPQAAAAHLATIGELTADVQRELRALIADLRPADLDADGLAAALAHHSDLLARASNTAVVVDADEVELDARRARELFLLAQEALHNALRHARASTVTVTLAHEGGTLRLSVADDGDGFDPADPTLQGRHLGLASMRERARAAGGRVHVDSAPGAGTTVTAELADG